MPDFRLQGVKWCLAQNFVVISIRKGSEYRWSLQREGTNFH